MTTRSTHRTPPQSYSPTVTAGVRRWRPDVPRTAATTPQLVVEHHPNLTTSGALHCHTPQACARDATRHRHRTRTLLALSRDGNPAAAWQAWARIEDQAIKDSVTARLQELHADATFGGVAID